MCTHNIGYDGEIRKMSIIIVEENAITVFAVTLEIKIC